MVEILAKSKNNITLKEHTIGLFEQLRVLIDKVPLVKKYEKHLKLAAFCHDLGKVSPSFQLSVKNWKYEPRPLFPDIPHSIFSLLWIDTENLKNEIPDETDRKILLSAIAFHHWRDNFHEIILGSNREFLEAINSLIKNPEVRNRLFQNLIENLSDARFNDYQKFLKFNDDLAYIILNDGSLLEYILPPYFGYFLPYRIVMNDEEKTKWITISGSLMRVDHFASYVQEEDIEGIIIEKDIPEYETVRKNIELEISRKTKKSIWQLKEIENLNDNNVVLIAPTGSGKTEFAFLWGGGNKLIFTLPLRSAVNSIYNRSMKYFGKESCGLLHSDADIYLFTKEIGKEGESLRVLDMARQLSLPLLVTTGDQIFPSALKYPGYEKIYSTLCYSKLVIDEVQAYDPRAVAVIVKLIEDIVKLGSRFLLMTATLPNFAKEQIEERVGKENFQYVNLYEDDSCRNIIKHKVELYEGDIEEKINDILSKAREGKRVLVILNTVEKAQGIYNKIYHANKDNIYLRLIHSRFTLDDRNTLEDEIVGTESRQGLFSNPKSEDKKDGKILVATQVVEASLDIDADVLFTELAPIDMLIQRMGRVYRRVRDSESYQKYLDSKEPSEPNIVIFYKRPDKEAKTKITTGDGTVYHHDLLVFSLALLLSRANPDLISETQIEEFKKRHWKEGKKHKSKNKDSLAGFIKDLFKKIGLKRLRNNGPRKKKKSSTSTIMCFSLSETDKKTLVERLYNLLPKDSNYLQRFHETLEILDSGFMSDRKQDALRIFREIYTVPAIPEHRVIELKTAITEFIKGNKLNFTLFKLNVLSRFIVNIDIRRYIRDNRLTINDASYLVYEIDFDNPKQMDKIKKWLNGIYIFDGVYDPERGVISDRTNNVNTDSRFI